MKSNGCAPLVQHIDNDPKQRREAQLLKRIPGIADERVSRILAYLSEPMRRCKHVRQVVADVGLDP